MSWLRKKKKNGPHLTMTEILTGYLVFYKTIPAIIISSFHLLFLPYTNLQLYSRFAEAENTYNTAIELGVRRRRRQKNRLQEK